MNLAKTGDLVVSVACRCGSQMVAAWGVPTWRCSSCRQTGKHGGTFRLLDSGWEAA